MRKWFKDKWGWLNTFNKKPQIVIDGDMLAFLTKNDKYPITCLGRIELIINGDIITFNKNKEEFLEVYKKGL
jgi:hypothetical protein